MASNRTAARLRGSDLTRMWISSRPSGLAGASPNAGPSSCASPLGGAVLAVVSAGAGVGGARAPVFTSALLGGYSAGFSEPQPATTTSHASVLLIVVRDLTGCGKKTEAA